MTLRLTDPTPLRLTSNLGEFTQLSAIPCALGTVTLSPIRYDGSGYLFLLSDGIIEGVDSVEYQGRTISTWALRQSTDASGRPVSVLETEQQIESPSDLSVTLRGLLHPTTGEALDRPDLQIWYFLSEICGYDITQAELDDLRAAAQSAGLITGGVIDDSTLSIQAWLDRITAGSGLAWSRDYPGWALTWPPTLGDAVATFNRYHSPQIVSSSSAVDLATVLELQFDYDWAARDYRGSLRLSAPEAVARYGERIRRTTLPWVHDARAAITHAGTLLAYHARPLWTCTASAPPDIAQVGDTVDIEHAHAPITQGLVTHRSRGPIESQYTIEAPHGSAPTTQVDRLSSSVAIDGIEAPEFDYQSGLATVLIVNSDGDPLPGARVTLNGDTVRTADAQGWVQFAVPAGEHSLYVVASGYEPYTLPLVIA